MDGLWPVEGGSCVDSGIWLHDWAGRAAAVDENTRRGWHSAFEVGPMNEQVCLLVTFGSALFGQSFKFG